MKKLSSLFKKIDENLVHISLLAYIVLVSLLPKIPLQHVEYTYIRIRYDDFLPVLVGLIFFVQFVREKIHLNTRFLIPVFFFWVTVFISSFVGFYFQNTIPVHDIGFLHSIRRIQYMALFFVASSAILSEKRFLSYLKVYLGTVFIVCLYALGQKFLAFPSIQSMNPAYVDGRLLILNAEDRINSTFGGHFDLAAYLTFSMPIILGFYFFTKKKKYFLLFLLSLIVLLYTAARSSFFAYLVSITVLLLFLRRFKLYVLIIFLTAVLLVVTGDMARRFQQTFQIKTVFLNEQTGAQKIEQKISVNKLPAGGLSIPLSQKKSVEVEPERIKQVALEDALTELKQKGTNVNIEEAEKRAEEIARYIKPQQILLCDISCATRLQVEWPRAIGAFLSKPIFGTGPSSITEATDNDYLRWLGEFGLIGSGLFIFLLYSLSKAIWQNAMRLKSDIKYLHFGYLTGFLALLVNGLYVDVFEASKIAYNFWLIAGFYVGFISLKTKGKFV